MPDEVALILEIGVEVFVWVRPGIVLLKELLGDKELGAPFAFEKLLLLLGRQLQQVLVGGEGLLLELELFLESSVLVALLCDRGSDLLGLLVGVLVVQVQALGQCFEIVLRIDQVLD
jgi:hypothetical protein